jgi:uncharacterized protein DUF2804
MMRLRKRWRYVAVFADELMLCAARVQVGPLGQTFWALLDRPSGELLTQTRLRLPGTSGDVQAAMPGGPPGATEVGIRARELIGTIRLGEGKPWEATCPTTEGRQVWTRKRVAVPAACELHAGDGRTWKVEGLGVEDETDGFHPRHTVWNWSAGVGETADGRVIGWNLVEGVNDPQAGSERAIWVDGEPTEAPTPTFHGLDAVDFTDGSRLEFTKEAERGLAENRLVVRYSYRQPFGTFTGTLPGGVDLAHGMGVMEHHDAWW